MRIAVVTHFCGILDQVCGGESFCGLGAEWEMDLEGAKTGRLTCDVIAHGIGTQRRFAKCDRNEERGRLPTIIVTFEEGRLRLYPGGDGLGELIMLAGGCE